MSNGGSAIDTRGRIVAAAFDLLAVHGVRALTLDRVACHAKLSKGAVFYHFKSKEDLIGAMLRQAIDGCTAKVAGGPPGIAGAEAWRSLVRALIAAACMSPQALANNASLFADLSRGFTDRKGNGASAKKAMAAAIGTAFLDELGLSITARWRE